MRQLEGPLETIRDEKKSYMPYVPYPSKIQQAITNGICLLVVGKMMFCVPKNHGSQAHVFPKWCLEDDHCLVIAFLQGGTVHFVGFTIDSSTCSGFSSWKDEMP